VCIAVLVAVGCGQATPPSGRAATASISATATADCAAFRFDRSAWADLEHTDASGLTPRQHLADRAVACRFLDGRDRAFLQRLLGPADEHGAGQLLYLLGDERGPVKLDGEYLELTMSADGKVADVQISD
jgi:hypothetical protein